MFAFQWREFSPPLSSAHRLLQCYHSQWEIGDAAIPGEFPPQPTATIGSLANERAVSSDDCDVPHSGRENLHQFLSILLWRHALSLVVLWLCALHSIDCPDDGYSCVRKLENKEIRIEMAVINHSGKCNQYRKRRFSKIRTCSFQRNKNKESSNAQLNVYQQ